MPKIFKKIQILVIPKRIRIAAAIATTHAPITTYPFMILHLIKVKYQSNYKIDMIEKEPLYLRFELGGSTRKRGMSSGWRFNIQTLS